MLARSHAVIKNQFQMVGCESVELLRKIPVVCGTASPAAESPSVFSDQIPITLSTLARSRAPCAVSEPYNPTG